MKKLHTGENHFQKVAEIRSQNRFLARSILLTETGNTRIIHNLILFIFISLIIFMIWASLMKIDEISSAKGTIQPQGDMVKIQHLTGGKITKILVEPGKEVKAGEPLLELDPESAHLHLQEIITQRAELEGSIIRITALLNRVAPDFSPIAKYPLTVADQKRLYLEHVSKIRSGRSIIAEQLAQVQSDLTALDLEEKKLRTSESLTKQEVTMRKELVEKGLNSKISLIELERSYNEITHSLQQIPSQRISLESKKSELQDKLAEFESQNRESYAQELSKLNGELLTVKNSVTLLEKSAGELIVRSPVDGFIQWITPTSNVEIAGASSTLMEILPKERELRAMIEISSRDVGHIRVGQSVSIKLNTYNFRRYGDIKGKLISVSPSSFLSPDGQTYFKGVVSLSKSYVGKKEFGFHVMSGMTLQADIQTGSKTLLEYLMKPIYYSVQYAFRER